MNRNHLGLAVGGIGMLATIFSLPLVASGHPDVIRLVRLVGPRDFAWGWTMLAIISTMLFVLSDQFLNDTTEETAQ